MSAPRATKVWLLLVALPGCAGGPAEGNWVGTGTLDPLVETSGFDSVDVTMVLVVGGVSEDWPLEPCGLVPAEARADDPNAFAVEDVSCTFEDFSPEFAYTTPRLELLFIASDPIKRTGTLQIGGEGEVSVDGAAPVAALLQASLTLDQPLAFDAAVRAQPARR